MQNDVFKTHKTQLNKIYSALKLRQKMNNRCTQLILSPMNEAKVKSALEHINEAIKHLNF